MKRIFSSAHVLLKSSRKSLRSLHSQTVCCSVKNSDESTNSPNKLVIFDKDGTLTCFHAMWSPWCEETATRMENASGKKISDDIYNFLSYDKTSKRVGKGNLAEKPHQWLKDEMKEMLISQHGMEKDEAHFVVYDLWMDSFDVEGTCQTRTVKPIGDVKSVIQTLRDNGYKIAVCTSDSRTSTEIALESIGVSGLIDRLLCGDDPDNTAKPAPDNVFMLCKELGVKPENTTMIGDTPADTVMGRLSKCGTVIGVLSGIGDEKDLSEADFVVKTVEEALNIIVLGSPSPNTTTFTPGSSHPSFTSPSSSQGGTSEQSARMFHTSSSLQRNTPYISQTRNISSHSNNEYSHIIVGAGSAGCVLANRLSEDPKNSVLLLEAGPKDTIMNSARLSWKIHMPAALTYNLCDEKYNWYYNTTPQKHANNRVMYWPRGRVWGGSSSLNAMVYIRGHAYDYDRWQQEGAQGWDYDHCLPYFKKAQNHELGGDTYRGSDGPLNVTQGDTSGPLFQAFIEAGQQAGYPYTPDMNGYQQEGFGPMDMTIHNGYRWSAASAYLRPALERSNLHAEVKCMTTKILFDGNRATGIECIQNGVKKEYYTEGEVIVSGGAINSPQLMMLSGIGNADDLKSLDIPVVHHLPGVGQNLQDHLELYIQHKCKKPITLYSAQQPLNMIRIGAEWLLKQTGLGASTHLHAGGFIRSKEGITHPDIQFHFIPSQVIDHGRVNSKCHAFQVHVGTLRETSRGWLKLKSKDPKEHPILEPNYMETEEDRVDLRQCVKLTREIFQQKAFDELKGEEIKPGIQVQSDSEIDAFVRAACDSAYHPSCTCKMGSESDPMAVVDSNAKVMGIQNLRVVDASIMPSVASGNLNSPTIMMAEKIADVIREKEPLHMHNTPVYKPQH